MGIDGMEKYMIMKIIEFSKVNCFMESKAKNLLNMILMIWKEKM